MEEERDPRRRWLSPPWRCCSLRGAAVGVLLLAMGGEEEASAQTVRFQEPTDDGPDPFTKPADGHGGDRVRVGSGPFGGTGSDLVCDRELLIDSLAARPDRLREWARVLGLRQDQRRVAAYIRRLRPVTLTRDTRVTNHSFVDGRAVAFQSILQAGTAVLVDKDGVPVARCRCGNPLLEPVFIEEAECFGCPPDYRPPPPCEYYDYDDREYDRYGDAYWKRIYVRSDFVDVCYLPYPDPPRVNRRPGGRAAARHAAGDEPVGVVLAGQWHGGRHLHPVGSGFRANATLTIELTRPDGVGESYSLTTDGSGSGSYTFPRVSDPVLGTYTAIRDRPGHRRQRVGEHHRQRGRRAGAGPDRGPGSQLRRPPVPLESEQCADSREATRSNEAAPDPNYDCPDQPPAHPGEDYLQQLPGVP